MDSKLECEGYITQVGFECPDCGEDIATRVNVPKPDFSFEDESDKISDGEVEVQCSNCQTIFDGYAEVILGECKIELIKHPSTAVYADMPSYTSSNDPDEAGSYELPDDPYRVFLSTIGPLRGILEEFLEGHTGRLLRRMVFSQSITAFEAYFSDTLIMNVTAVPDAKMAMAAIIEGDQTLSEMKLSLADVLANPEIVKHRIETSLRNRIYHRLDKVARLYSVALDICITPHRDDLTRLNADIGFRHDCVHRNGMDKDGNYLDFLTKEYISQTIDVVERFVEHTEKQVRDHEIINF